MKIGSWYCMPVHIPVPLHVAALDLVVRLSRVFVLWPIERQSHPHCYCYCYVNRDHNGVRETGFELKSLMNRDSHPQLTSGRGIRSRSLLPVPRGLLGFGFGNRPLKTIRAAILF